MWGTNLESTEVNLDNTKHPCQLKWHNSVHIQSNTDYHQVQEKTKLFNIATLWLI